MKPMYPVVTASSQGIAGNDSRHNKLEPTNKSGGPSLRTRKAVPTSSRGGTGHQGRDRVHVKARMGGGRATASNPASRGGNVQHGTAETRNPNRGGGVQTKPGRDMQRNFGTSGKTGVVNDYANANPQPSAGNVGGRMSRRIAGRFNNKSKQAGGGTGTRGSYGSMPVQLSD